MIIVFLGASGTGKGTHAKIIGKKMGINHFSMGDALREAAKEKNDLGKKIDSYVKAGKLVPFEWTIKLFKKALKSPKYKKGIVIDGFPRNMDQANSIDKIATIDKLVVMELSEKEIVKRLSGRWTCKECGEIYNIPNKIPKKEGLCDKCDGKLYQREDDKPAAIKQRFQFFEKEVMPVIKHYEKKGIVVKVSSKGSIEEVSKRVEKVVLN